MILSEVTRAVVAPRDDIVATIQPWSLRCSQLDSIKVTIPVKNKSNAPIVGSEKINPKFIEI